MAKKARTPRPPRPVQAPKRRDATPQRRLSGGSVPRWAWIAGIAVVAAIVAGAIALSGGSKGASADVKATMLAAGCTDRDVKPFPPKDATKAPVGTTTPTSRS